ncbi:MAG: histidine phosphatase family protein, partial [Patescibacteria group bacterium]
MKLKNNYYLLRHGEARSNKERFVSCWPEKIYNPLTSKGIKQIKELIPILKKEKIDLIFSSDLLRCKQTTEIVAKKLNLEIIFNKRLREIDVGNFNGKSVKDWGEFFTKYKKFKEHSHGGENWTDVRKRMLDFINNIDKRYENRNIIIVGHG